MESGFNFGGQSAGNVKSKDVGERKGHTYKYINMVESTGF